MSLLLRHRFIVTGQVQGVGFRPFVYRIAAANAVTGTVNNSSQGVIIEVQGTAEQVETFGFDLTDKLPPLARVVSLHAEPTDPVADESGFTILKSTGGAGHSVLISADVATCPDCMADIATPGNRRHRYPFTNCTNCGPRYTITRSIPYDRPMTSMACFPQCPQCQAEYDDPMDRRFHAQPNACPACGPQVWLTDPAGTTLARGDEAIRMLAEALAQGRLAAVKGLGGFHLVCDAASDKAVAELRRRKHRPDKPLAVMLADLEAVRQLAVVVPAEEPWLTGIRRPIVLAAKREPLAVSPLIAPDTNFLGVMLPYTPLHHILLDTFAQAGGSEIPALVMTSGNLSSEPIALGNREALARLGELADLFLLHDRDILIRTDDSVVRVNPASGGPVLLRRARGFAPEPVFLAEPGPTVLGTGPELKCTLTLTKGDQAFPSQHIGNMANLETLAFYREILDHMQDILRVRPELIVRDLHPDYMTSALAEELGQTLDIPVIKLQHHVAHIHAVLAENKFTDPVIGLALDGTGLGEDGTIWGGECLMVDPESLEHQRLAHFSHIRLPGGEAAVRQPWRIAQAALWELGVTAPGAYPWPWLAQFEQESAFLPQMLTRGVNSPRTSSCGRLFDAVAALCGLTSAISYEGQAAILLEKAQDMTETGAYPCPLKSADPVSLNTLELVAAALDDLGQGVPVGTVARRFHLGLINGLTEMAFAFSTLLDIHHVALSGGVMQNLTLAAELPRALERAGLIPLVHRHLPPNDGCISLGQAVWGQRYLRLHE
ncbi:MAG: carbamoyltransferase HypF [Pseudodesulfovibrio sp.]|uniref:Carbamoyltransferase n=1 Tax=Pseudodesulfovibrio aespoeensis (strain ATCC 700646 / DSM 10631 / Aspo-2) TaxID=643562 RepID=E6VTT2_PSEA9|nr:MULTISPECIES: carbamoyltransferase HypF [Pseudodesulfovibrio]MBU4190991.1 carbamoyltransferase HypF [Pseudomonadota bacterium]ADU63369.1 (NiFe) hydrogenase maturation protein HypF [Pseudodesulfovibrio aespoeensis Aspo-2]MBU4245197.1 carbamoyltransferase HypF [Pseudomonadota bacterium]MBU4379889.1 carbamoyltransferase HypF [Pseudomonadota bacterium]MBU4476042.1 carbamoyltransferase HypF [Pseudomonadota bacterium]